MDRLPQVVKKLLIKTQPVLCGHRTILRDGAQPPLRGCSPCSPTAAAPDLPPPPRAQRWVLPLHQHCPWIIHVLGTAGQGKCGTSAPEELSRSAEPSAKLGQANEDIPSYQLNLNFSQQLL